jgi:hypothetical protein
MSLIFAAPLLMVVMMLGLQTKALAAPQEITMTPTVVNQAVQVGTTYEGSFQILNHGASNYDFKVYALPYHVSGEAYEPGFTYTPGATKVSDWFKFAVTKATIKPGDSITVPYSITVPVNTPPGGYYAVAFAETKFPEVTNGVTLNQRVGEIFYLQVPGELKQSGDLLNWDVSMFQSNPLTAAVRIQNSGNLHFATNIHVAVSDIFGSAKYTFDTTKFLLPQTIRKIPISWDKTPSIGLFKVNGTATILGKTHNLPTRYVLVMSPLARLIFAVLFVAIILGAGSSTIIKKKRNRKTFKKYKRAK